MSSPEIRIRRADVEDADVLAQLNVHVQGLHETAEPKRYRATSRAEVAQWFATRLAGPGAVAFLAESERPVGYLLAFFGVHPRHPFCPERSYFMVDQLAVEDGERRQGIGARLMRHAEAHARAAGFSTLELDVRAFNKDAVGFYEALGYRAQQLRLGLDL